MPHRLRDLFQRNREWAADVESRQPGFFTSLLEQQAPQYLWIGCSDSRVPANEIVGLMPGELFVHRNVANVIVHSDLNCLSVMQFAIDMLQVQHIIVVGHYGCSGVKAAMLNIRIGVADNWLRHVQDVRNAHADWLTGLSGDDIRLQALCELNVLEQSRHVCEATVVQDAWARGQNVVVHGWVYGLHNGLLEDLQFISRGADEVAAEYDRALASLKLRYKAALPESPPSGEPG